MLIEAPSLSALPGLRHAFFTREGGVSTGLYASLNGGLGSADDTEAVAENRRRMADALAVAPGRLLNLHQIHSAEAVVATAPWPTGELPKADGMATREPGLALAIATADCGPVLFADAEAGIVGACHAGWKGALTGIVEATVAAMEGLGARRAAITAVLGPTIGPAAYEVGPDFTERLLAVDATHERYLLPAERPGHHRFDLPRFIADRAREAGLGSFTNLALCTYSDPARFYSFRRTTHQRQADYGRLISAIALTTSRETSAEITRRLEKDELC